MIAVGEISDRLITNKTSGSESVLTFEISKNVGQKNMQAKQAANIATNKVVVSAVKGLHKRYSIARPVSVKISVDIVEIVRITLSLESEP